MKKAYLDNIAFILFSFFYVVFRGRAIHVPKSLKKILVVQSAKMGDMVAVTSVFRAIKKQYPNIHLSVVGMGFNRELLVGNKDVDEYITYKYESPPQWWKIYRAQHFDVALLTAPDTHSLAMMFLSGIPLVVTPTITGTKAETETVTYKLLSMLVKKVTYVMVTAYTPREYLKILEPIGIVTEDTTKHLAYSEHAKQSVLSFFEKHRITYGKDFIVGVAPSAGNKVKSWLPDRYAETIQYLIQKYNAKIVIIGGPSDKVLVDAVMEHLPDSSEIINTTSQFSIEELKALVAHLNIFISGDTGPIHIAAAFEIPSVNILGPVGEIEMPPRGPFHRNVIPPRKRPELYVMTVRQFDPVEAQKQINDTTVGMVKETIDTLIRDIKKPS